MDIHQLSVNYVQEQDRLLLRVNSAAAEELRLWLTRRLVLGLLPVLKKSVADVVAYSAAGATPVVLPDEQAKHMLADFKREEALKRSDFSTPYKSQAANLPLGPEPLLVTEVSVTVSAAAPLQLAFKEILPDQAGQARAFQMALEPPLMHGLMHLLDKALAASGWLDTGMSAGAAISAQVSETFEKPKYLN
jgi:hypothetical protein